jgi:hypothetical protein
MRGTLMLSYVESAVSFSDTGIRGDDKAAAEEKRAQVKEVDHFCSDLVRCVNNCTLTGPGLQWRRRRPIAPLYSL